MTFMALGPAGINIITNHSMGFFGSQDVFAAMTHTSATLMLYNVSEVWNVEACQNLRGPDDVPDNRNGCHGNPV
jgi:hypothetical protein